MNNHANTHTSHASYHSNMNILHAFRLLSGSTYMWSLPLPLQLIVNCIQDATFPLSIPSELISKTHEQIYEEKSLLSLRSSCFFRVSFCKYHNIPLNFFIKKQFYYIDIDGIFHRFSGNICGCEKSIQGSFI